VRARECAYASTASPVLLSRCAARGRACSARRGDTPSTRKILPSRGECKRAIFRLPSAPLLVAEFRASAAPYMRWRVFQCAAGIGLTSSGARPRRRKARGVYDAAMPTRRQDIVIAGRLYGRRQQQRQGQFPQRRVEQPPATTLYAARVAAGEAAAAVRRRREAAPAAQQVRCISPSCRCRRGRRREEAPIMRPQVTTRFR